MDHKDFPDFVDTVTDRYDPQHEVVGVLCEYTSNLISFSAMLQRLNNLLIGHTDLLLALHKLNQAGEKPAITNDQNRKSPILNIEKAPAFSRKPQSVNDEKKKSAILKTEKAPAFSRKPQSVNDEKKKSGILKIEKDPAFSRKLESVNDEKKKIRFLKIEKTSAFKRKLESVNGEKKKSRILKIEKASAFRRKLESVSPGADVLRAFNNAMVYFRNNFRIEGSKKVNKNVVIATDKRVGVIFNEYPELYIDFTTLMASCLEKKSIPLESEIQRNKGWSRTNRYHRKYRRYEKNVFEMEDSRCENDVERELLKSTVKRVQEIMEGSSEGFSGPNMRCIKKYSKYGSDVVEKLRAQPKMILPEICTSLCQKLEEMENERISIDKDLKRALKKLGS